MSVFGKKLGSRAVATPLQKLVGMIQATFNANKIGSAQLTRSALSTESLRDDEVHALTVATADMSTSLEAISEQLGMSSVITPAQIEAGTAAGLMAGDINTFLAHRVETPMVSTESVGVVISAGQDDAMTSRAFGLEAYDERENRNASVYSVAYNMQSARQDEFGETFFPTIVVTPDQVGFAVTVRLMTVFNELQRNISGALDNFDKKNIIRAIADPTILKNEMTRIVPVVRAQSLGMFVDATVIAARTLMLEGEAIQTAPLATGKKMSLLGLSQTDTLLANGIMDMTDSIDPAINLQAAYLRAGDDVVQFNVNNLPLSNFTYTSQNNYRVMTLNFDTTSVMLTKTTKNVDGSALVDLAAIVTGDLIVRLALTMSGQINIETGDCGVYSNHVGVHSVQNAAGELLDLASGPGLAVVTAFADATIIGYDLQAYRTNMNRRQRGQLIDVTNYTQIYNVPLRSPITAIRPISADGQSDASDLQALITATRIRTSNAGVGALVNAAQMLREYVDARDTVGTGPDILGVGRFFARPTYYEETIDMNDIVDSLKSHERAADIQAAIVNKVRDYAYRMYRDSEYKAGADALAGGISAVPVVIIGTDPVLARYLQVSGDLRTLGGEFDVRIVSTLDRRVQGKIFITFGVFDENRNSAPNPLNFGNMAWSPELTMTVPITRNGAISKETVVQPRFQFVVNLPVMTVLVINNVPDVINKVPLHMVTL